MTSNYLAFDLGAESGRAVSGRIDEGILTLAEIHRFANRPVFMKGTLCWDFPAILAAAADSLTAFHQRFDGPPSGISCDSWGVDFGLLDCRGNLLGCPVHYRDRRTEGRPEQVFSRVPVEEIYAVTGIQLMALNTLFQIEHLVAVSDPQWEAADRFLLMADLVNHFLSGAEVVESSLASTTHLYDAKARGWSRDLIERLGYPPQKFPEIVPSGTRIGTLDEALIEHAGLPTSFRNTPVIASLSHDTAAAVAAVPADRNSSWAYLSSGTWSLLGVELGQPILTEQARRANFTNEAGAEGTIRFLKNIMGLWILQECRRVWEKEEGQQISYTLLMTSAEQAGPSETFIDPDDPRFFTPGDMPKRVREFCVETDQVPPEGIGPLTRCILDSLALKYRQCIQTLQGLTGMQIERLHIVGGGSQNRLLNQTVADVLGIPVVVGPTEATALGNIVTQAVAMFELEDLWAGRGLVRNSFAPEVLAPRPGADWEGKYERFLELVS
jgi:sugar (pentulose or hexulose) kinase